MYVFALKIGNYGFEFNDGHGFSIFAININSTTLVSLLIVYID